MNGRGSRRTALAVGGVAVLLVAGALLLPDGLSFEDDSRGPREPVVPDLPGYFDLLLIALAVAAFVSVAIVLVAFSLRRDPSAPVRRKGPGGILFVLVLTALVASVFATSRSLREEQPVQPPPAMEAEERVGGPSEDPPGANAAGILLTSIVVLLVVGGPLAAWRFARTRIPEEVREEAFEERLLEELDASIVDLSTIRDPRAAVIACYGRLQGLARWAGIRVRPSDTSMELLDALASRSPALEPGAARLVALFQTARFSPHPLGEGERAEALTALTEVREQLVVRA